MLDGFFRGLAAAIADIRAHIIHDDRAANLSMPDPTGAFGNGPGEGAMPDAQRLHDIRAFFGMDRENGHDPDKSIKGPAHDAPDHGIDR